MNLELVKQRATRVSDGWDKCPVPKIPHHSTADSSRLAALPSLADLARSPALWRLASRATRRPNSGNLFSGTEHWEIGIRGLIIGVVVTWKRGSTIQDRLRLLRLTTTRRADITSFTPEVKGISVLLVTDSHSRPPGS